MAVFVKNMLILPLPIHFLKRRLDLLHDLLVFGYGLGRIHPCCGGFDLGGSQNDDLDDVFEADDIVSIGYASKMTGMDTLEDIEEPDDLEDIELEGFYAMQMTLEDATKAEDFMDYLSDALDMVDIDTKDLSKQEFYSSKNEGFIRVHLSVSELVEALEDNDDIMDMIEDSYYPDELVDALESLSGDVYISAEINGANIFIIFGFGINTEAESFKEAAKAFSVPTDMTKLPTNEAITEAVINGLFDGVQSYLEKAAAAATAVAQHNADIEAVESEIDEALNGV